MREPKPEHPPGNLVFHPCDKQVDGSAIERAAIVLRALGIDPFAHAERADDIGIDFSNTPIIGAAARQDDDR